MKLTHEFELGGEKVTGRCTFRAINEFEESAGMSISEAWLKLADDKLPFSLVARAVCAFINGERLYQGQRPEIFEVVGEKMHKDNFINFVGVAGKFFLLTIPESDEVKQEEGEKKS